MTYTRGGIHIENASKLLGHDHDLLFGFPLTEESIVVDIGTYTGDYLGKLIAANSSFHWWGAWLGDSEVIAPKEWLVGQPYDIVPARWATL